MPLIAFDLALELIRHLRAPLEVILKRDPSLADQLRRAAASIALNLSEGSLRSGRDRMHLWRVAAGSVAEVAACLRVAEAWGHVDADTVSVPLQQCDRLLAITWRLTHARPVSRP
jgi:four helix bundle protein